MMREELPLITVIIPVYNLEESIPHTIRSLLDQAFKDFEVIVVDDGSTDGSADAAIDAIGQDPRFRLVRQDNQGLSGARNTGLDQAAGDFVAFLDADDRYAPNFLATLHDAIEADGTDWAACGVTLVFPDGRTQAHPAIHDSDAPPARGVIDLADARTVASHFPSAWNKLYRRSLFDTLRFPEGTWFEDHEVFWSIAARHPRLSYVPEPLYLYSRGRPGQITERDDDKVFEQLDVLKRLSSLVLTEFENGRAGLERLSSRLIHERAAALRNLERRRAFLNAAAKLLSDMDCRYRVPEGSDISRALALSLDGELPLSVVLLAPDRDQLRALDAQLMQDFEVFVKDASAASATELGHALRPYRRDAISGRYVVVLGAGEYPLPEGFMHLVNAIEESGCQWAMGAFERQHRGYHDGWTDNRVLDVPPAELPLRGAPITLSDEAWVRVFPAIGNHIVKVSAFRTLPEPDTNAFGRQNYVLDLASSFARVCYTRLPVLDVRDVPSQVASVNDIAAWLRSVELKGNKQGPKGWRGILFWRFVGVRAAKFGPREWVRACLAAMKDGFVRGANAGRPDPESPRWLRAILPRR